MPTVNFYTQQTKVIAKLQSKFPEIREFLAHRLSCHERKLQPAEISLRIIEVTSGEMISPLEVEITAFAYPERVNQQDVICRDVVTFLKQCSPDMPESHVWLILGELGHSWTE